MVSEIIISSVKDMSKVKNGSIGAVNWSIGPELTLQRESGISVLRSGYMVVTDESYDGTGNDIGKLTDSIVRECDRLGARGIIFDFEKRRFAQLDALIGEVISVFRRGPVFVPERYSVRNAYTVVHIAQTTGTLSARLREAGERYGDMFAVDYECLRRDTLLPGTQSRVMTEEELKILMKNRATFYSSELCARYFTYKSGEEHHYIIFDNTETKQKKCELASRFGARYGIFLYPEHSALSIFM